MPAWRRIEAASNRPSQGGAHYRKFVPGIEGDNRLWWHRRQISGLPQHAAPFLQPLFLVSVEIADQGALGRSQAGHLCLLDCSLRAREDRIDRGKFFRKWAGVIIELHSCTSRLAIGLRACRLDDTAGSMFDCGPACPLKLLSPL